MRGIKNCKLILEDGVYENKVVLFDCYKNY